MFKNVKFFKHKIYQLTILITLLSLSLSNLPINLNETKTGEMKNDESFEYYELKMPSDIESNKYILVFVVKEDKKNILEGEEVFSDPDIYISKTQKDPHSPQTSDYYSERYGNDILSIPSSEVNPNDIFYIGMYCQFSCKYKLKAYLSEEIEIEIGKMYSIEMKRKSSLNYILKIPNQEYKELNVISNSNGMEEFKIYMSKTTPSSQNTIKVIPSWASGYLINIDKYSKDYCTDCSYHILLQSGKEDCTIQLFAYFQNSITKVLSGNPIQDAMKSYGKRCYAFDVFNKNNLKNQKIVISITLFSGNALIVIEGFQHNDNLNYENAKNNKFSYEVLGEKSILLDNKDILNLPNSQSGNINELYYCIFSSVSISYTMTTYFLNQAQSLQQYNFILPKTEVTGFLPDGQYTKYQVGDFSSVSKQLKANITISFSGIVGFPKVYAFFCIGENECFFDKDYFIQNQRNNKLINSIYTSFQDSVIFIEGYENKCYEDDFCDLLVVVSCSSVNTGYCQYKLSANIEETSLLMSPRTSYYSIISVGKIDKYQININDDDIESVVIVLNTASGNAELEVYEMKESSFEDNELKKIGMSINKDYLPDVVRITPKRLNKENLIGSYIVKVTADTFSSYYLYYYTTYKRKEEDEKEEYIPDEQDVSLTLQEGIMLTDYFPNDIDYKIYTYQPNLEEPEDLKFIITPINVKFSFKVFLYLDDFEYDDEETNEFDRIKGYEWSSDINGELLIKTDDELYSLDNTYYIVVYMNNPEDNTLSDKSVMKYYLGVTTPSIPFILFQGIEQTGFLTNDYPIQTFWYLHNDLNNPFEIDINSLYGEIDVYVDVEEITEEKIDKVENGNLYDEEYEDEDYLETSLTYIRKIKDFDSIILEKEYLEKYCSGDIDDDDEFYGCRIFIYIKRSKHTIKNEGSSQFLIVANSNEKFGEILVAGTSKNDYVYPGEYNYYIIEEIRKKKGNVISVIFNDGIGDVYLRIPEKPEYGDDIIFPTDKNYTLKGNDTYNGKVIVIPDEYFQKINNENIKIQLFIAVKGEVHNNEYGEEENDIPIEYSISYSSDKMRLNQNFPFESYINSGEYKYFDLYFDKNVKNIYISLSNMDGDADLYLNYGDKIFPTPKNYNWKSTNTGHEYIDFNIEHSFFKKNNITSLEGHYTLLVIGYTSTTFTLFVSSHETKVIPLNDNSPMTCKCENNLDKCYFRYDDVYSIQNSDLDIEKSQIVFALNYFYGNGELYAKISKDSEINNIPKGSKLYSFFPDKNNNDFSTLTSKQRNFLRVKVKEEKYTKDTIILLTYECGEKALLEINSAKLSYDAVYDYLDVNRENIYFLKYNKNLPKRKQPSSLLSFYNIENHDIIYNLHSYIGQGRIEIYTNESYYDKEEKKIKYDYEAIGDFILGDDNLESTEQDQISNYIESTSNIQKKTIFFKVQPITNFGFYIQLLYDNSWKRIQLGKSKEFFVKNDKLMGYFDIYDEYDGIEFTLNLENVRNKKASVYIKINQLEKKDEYQENSSPENAYKYIIPTNKLYDYKDTTDKVLGLLSIEMNNLPKIDKENKFIRALFLVEIKNDRSRLKFPFLDDDNNLKESTVHILVNPSENKIKRVEAKQLEVFYSNISAIYDKNGNLETVSEKIYSLEKNDEDDDLMVIEISSCRGDFEYKISSNYNMSVNDIIYEENEENGRKVIILKKLKEKHVYFSIKASSHNDECEEERKSQCNQRLSYLMYYYSTTKSNFEVSYVDEDLTYVPIKQGVKIIIPQISARNIKGEIRDFSEYKFDLFLTLHEDRLSSMGSICYLTRYIDEVDPLRFYRDINIENNEYYVKLDYSTTYYINILARNVMTGEIITFSPIIVKSGGYLSNSFWKSLFYYLFLCFLLVGIGYLIKILYEKYLKGNLLNFGGSEFNRNNSGYERADGYQRPGFNVEMPSIKTSDKQKYSTLSEDENKL